SPVHTLLTTDVTPTAASLTATLTMSEYTDITFTTITYTDLGRSSAKLRATSRRIEAGGFSNHDDRRLARSIGAHLQEASRHLEAARDLLPETGLDFHGEEDEQ